MIQTSENPHDYMWRIAGYLTTSGKPKYYIGGTTAGDPYYTHSAETSEEFRNLVPHSKRPLAERKAFIENPPPGISRRILKKFDVITEENEKEIKNKVWKTENKFLLNRKERCWDRYYNKGVGNPRYIDTSGENNGNYKHGKMVGAKNNPEIMTAYDKERDQTPKRKEDNRRRDARRRIKNMLETGQQRHSKKWLSLNPDSPYNLKYGEGKLDAFFEV